MDIIIIAGLIGAFGGLLCSFVFLNKKHQADIMKNKKNRDEEENVVSEPLTLTDRWSFRLAMLGFAMGIFAALGQGYLNIAFMIGFGLPFALILGLIGLVIDFFRNK